METQDWHPADIVAALKKKGWSQVALSRAWPALEGMIAHIIGEPPAVIWPSRYDNGVPRKQPRRAKSG